MRKRFAGLCVLLILPLRSYAALMLPSFFLALYTLYFSETFPRSAFDQSLDSGSPVLVSYDGEFNEYGQFSGVFAVSDCPESSIDGGD